MPLADPPVGAGSLADLPARPLAGTPLFRVWRRRLPDGSARASAWWFASRPDEAEAGGRFDLLAPDGTCYLATSLVGAVLEALQAYLGNLPQAELDVRAAVEVEPPGEAPDAADLTNPSTAGRGVTAGVWAGTDRARTRRWASALRRDGWWALHTGVHHDPSGTLRAVALFDHAGEHPPSHPGPWRTAHRELSAPDVLDRLAEFGVHVRGVANLPVVRPEVRRDPDV
jgi:hypothetical protein